MNVEKLDKIAASVRTGGKGSVRRKKKKNAGHKTDDKKRPLKTTTGGSNGKQQQPSVEELMSKSPLGLASQRKTTCDDDDIASDDEERIAAIAKIWESGGFHDCSKCNESKQKPIGYPPFWWEIAASKIKVEDDDDDDAVPTKSEVSKSKTRDDVAEDIPSDDDSDFAAHENFAERPLSRGYAHDARRRFELLRKPVRGPPPVVLETLAQMKSSGELDRLTKALFGSFPRPEDRAC